MQEYMQRKAVEQAARARAEKIQAVAAVQQRVQTAKEEADKAREVSHRSLSQGISEVNFVCCSAMSGLSMCWTCAPPLVRDASRLLACECIFTGGADAGLQCLQPTASHQHVGCCKSTFLSASTAFQVHLQGGQSGNQTLEFHNRVWTVAKHV